VANVTDSGLTGFRAGRAERTYVSCAADSGVILAPTLAAEFSGERLPPGWFVERWREDGSATVDKGALVISGARAGTEALFGAGRSLEFVATLSGQANQNIGFGTDFVAVPWVTFSTRFGTGLHARTNFYRPQDTRIPGDWLGAPHRFRIDWNVLDIVFSIDGSKVAKQLVPIVGFMRPMASESSRGRGSVLLEWMRLTPFAPAGSFFSRVFDAGMDVEWQQLRWTAGTPSGTSVKMSVHTGPTSEPGAQWSPWKKLGRSGAAVGAVGRFFQYRAELASTSPHRTPVLRDVTLAYRAPEG